MKKITSTVVMAVLCLHLNAQANTTKAEIGNIVPELFFDKVLYYKKPTINLSELRGRWILIDCWSAVCAPCIKGLPKVDSLQKIYPDQLQVLLVTDPVFYKNGREKTASKIPEVESIFNRIAEKQGHPLALPCALIDPEIFQKVFPYNFVPHYFIISPEGRLEAVTTSTSLAIAMIHSAMQETTSTH